MNDVKKYLAVRGCQWRDFTLYGVEGKTTVVDAADLKTPDGKPLPKAVVDHFVASGNLVPCDDDGNPLEKAG